MRSMAGWVVSVLAVAALVGAASCSSAVIAAKEKMGYAKREQLVDGVKKARDGQQDAKKQFESALAEFLALTGQTGGELEAKYKKLKSAYERSEDKAETVRSRIGSVENVASALFKEWRAELDTYQDQSLRAQSERMMNDTRANYQRLIGTMHEASRRMDPVLAAFKDRVTFLKHNLNAQAIAGLQGEAGRIEADVSGLVREMQASIDEANAFIAQMK